MSADRRHDVREPGVDSDSIEQWVSAGRKGRRKSGHRARIDRSISVLALMVSGGLVVLGWSAQTAYGAGTMSVQSGRIVYQAVPGDADNVTESTTAPAGFGTFFYPEGSTPIFAGSGCQATSFNGHAGVACPDLPVEFKTLDGSDSVFITGPGATIDMGSGNDLVTLYDGAGVADVHGGDGVDTVASGPTVSAAFLLDDVANDGGFFEDPSNGVTGSNVHSDVENLAGSGRVDILKGTAAANTIDGFGGPDVIDGGGGVDVIRGGTGADTIKSVDGAGDFVDCGDGVDAVNADTTDVTVNCETVYQDADGDGAVVPADCDDHNSNIRPGVPDTPDNGIDENCDGHDEVVLDRDGDGFNRPGDCDDRNAAIHPGATDTPANAIDEDCSGSDAVDLDQDRDSYARPVDCDDTNAAVHPGAPEKRGNGADENCDGTADPFLRITSGVPFLFRPVKGGRTRVILLAVRNAPVNSRIAVRCQGGGCKKRIRPIKATGIKQIPLMSHFPRPLRPKAVIEVRITAPDQIGKYLRFVMRRGKAPRQPTIRCIQPGTSRTSPCPSGT